DCQDHLPFASGADAIASSIQEFLTGVRPLPVSDSLLCTVMFTDIVGSTAMALEKGDQRWSDLLDAHNNAIRAELATYRGREINTTGDGFVEIVDGPAPAIRSP